MIANIEYAYKEFEKDGRVTNTRVPEMPPIRPVINELPLGENDTILELGSADGGLSLPIARLLKNRQGLGEIIACDFSKPRVAGLAQEASAVGVDDHLDVCCLSDAPPRTLPFDDAMINAVLSVNMLQYLADPEPYMEEISRVLAPCGTLLMADWNNSVSANGEASKRKGIGPERIRPMLEAAGLDANERIKMPGYAWAFRAVKPVLFTL